MDYTNHRIGCVSELKAQMFYAKEGYEIFTPLGPTVCDFIAVKGEEVIRVQVKTVNTAGRVLCINTARNKNSAKRSGKKPLPYSKKDCDAIIAVLGDNLWAILSEKIGERQTLCISKMTQIQ